MFQKQAILIRAHFINAEILSLQQQIQKQTPNYDVFLLIDKQTDTEIIPDCIKVHVFEAEKINSLGYPVISGRALWFHMDYPVIDFSIAYPAYQQIWIIEYDVRFQGDWSLFFSSFDNNNADVISSYLRSFSQDPYWKWWHQQNLSVPDTKLKAIFCPVIRISKRMLETLDLHHRQGICGYAEVIIPTLAEQSGFQVCDIGESFYDPLACFNFNYVIYRKKNMLCHPVKEKALYNKLAGIYRYIFRAKYDSHWSIRIARYAMFRLLRLPERKY